MLASYRHITFRISSTFKVMRKCVFHFCLFLFFFFTNRKWGSSLFKTNCLINCIVTLSLSLSVCLALSVYLSFNLSITFNWHVIEYSSMLGWGRLLVCANKKKMKKSYCVCVLDSVCV